jgi:hypothetical protein
VDDAYLWQMAASGQLQPGDQVWTEGTPNWVLVCQVS